MSKIVALPKTNTARPANVWKSSADGRSSALRQPISKGNLSFASSLVAGDGWHSSFSRTHGRLADKNQLERTIEILRDMRFTIHPQTVGSHVLHSL
jgi:hypothetical protein